MPKLRYAVIAAVMAMLAEGIANAEQPSGAALYRRFCASCHGTTGKGDGLVAPTLRQKPTDLTSLTRRAGGHFDERRVVAIIDGRNAVEAHGPREMPVWGAIFDAELQDEPYTGYTVLLRAHVLTDYLRTIQRKDD